MGSTLLWKYYEYDAELPNTRSHFSVKRSAKIWYRKYSVLYSRLGFSAFFSPFLLDDLMMLLVGIMEWMSIGGGKEAERKKGSTRRKECQNTNSKQHRYFRLTNTERTHCGIMKDVEKTRLFLIWTIQVN